MKSIFRFLFAIPRAIIRLIWRMFWGLIKTALVLAIVLFALNIYAERSNSALAQSLYQVKETVVNFFNSSSADELKQTLSNLSTDEFVAYDGARWTHPKATVYIEASNPTLVSAYQEALANWNATGAFTFTQVDNRSAAQIILTEESDGNSQAAGLAELKTNSLTNHITHVDIKLNRYYLLNNDFGYTYERIVNTAEHELGHAIGLSHDDKENSVMQSAGSYYGIQEVDIAAVRSLYQEDRSEEASA